MKIGDKLGEEIVAHNKKRLTLSALFYGKRGKHVDAKV